MGRNSKREEVSGEDLFWLCSKMPVRWLWHNSKFIVWLSVELDKSFFNDGKMMWSWFAAHINRHDSNAVREASCLHLQTPQIKLLTLYIKWGTTVRSFFQCFLTLHLVLTKVVQKSELVKDTVVVFKSSVFILFYIENLHWWNYSSEGSANASMTSAFEWLARAKSS